MDGASHQTGAGVGLQLKAPTRERIEQAIWLGFPASNNETKYEAIIIRNASQLVVGHVNGEYRLKRPLPESGVIVGPCLLPLVAKLCTNST